MGKPIISHEQIMKMLEKCYEGAVNGLPGAPTCKELAEEYLRTYRDRSVAIKKMIDAQISKCTASGFLTSLGGMITLPFAVPANVASVLYVQMRMIATIAVMGGYDPHNDEVQTLAYVCLVKSSVTDICKSAGIKITNKITVNLVKKIPGAVLTKINQKVGFRLLTKFGEKGIVNLAKVVPIFGGIVGGGIDFVETKAIAKKAYNTFILNIIE